MPSDIGCQLSASVLRFTVVISMKLQRSYANIANSTANLEALSCDVLTIRNDEELRGNAFDELQPVAELFRSRTQLHAVSSSVTASAPPSVFKDSPNFELRDEEYI